MNKSIKQIYAALEFKDDEIILLVAEYYNTRFNIIRVSRTKTSSIKDYLIIDKELLRQDIKKTVIECSNYLGGKIESVILLIPPLNFKKYSLKSTIIPENETLVKSDLARALTNSLKIKIDEDMMIVNTLISKYTNGSISSRRFPENELCDQLDVDIDLLCADKNLIYDYVYLVEECGLKVIDIAIRPLAIAKEAAILEESFKTNIINIDIGKYNTYLSLLSKGRLISSEIINDGLEDLAKVIFDEYHINDKDLDKLLKYSINYEHPYLDDIIYSNGSNTRISTRDLNNLIDMPLKRFVNHILEMCKPIIEKGATIFITGEGQKMKALVKMIEEKSNTTVKSYYPDTIGVKDSSLTSTYGALFIYKEKSILNNLNVTCIDLLQYDKVIDLKQIDVEGETITTKIKSFFKQYMEGENEK